MTWDYIIDFLGISNFVRYISSSQIQDMLFSVKIVFIAAGFFFLIFIIYFMMNSSWLQYKFLEDVTEFFSWQAYGQRQMQKQWNRIKRRTETGAEADYKLAIIDADDLLQEVLDSRGFEGDTFEEIVKSAGKLMEPVLEDILKAHEARNSIVYNPDFKITAEQVKKILEVYEVASKDIGTA